MDGPVAAVGGEPDAPVVPGDGDVTHEGTEKVVDVEECRR
jgi:hypothetical protein